jgi:hypothetical protein
MPGDLEGRIELDQRLKHEAPLRQPRVRYGQAGLVDDQVSIEQQIQVDGARPERGDRLSESTQPALDLEQAL